MKVVMESVTLKMVMEVLLLVLMEFERVMEDLLLVLMELKRVMEDLLLVLMEKVREMVVLLMEMVEIYKRKAMEELPMEESMENLRVVVCRCRAMEEPLSEKMTEALGRH